MLVAPIRPTPFAPMSRHSAQLTLTMPANKTRAVLPRGSWREPEIYAAIADFGVRGLDWELLRHNPDYPGCKIIGDLSQIAGVAVTARWGLHFRKSDLPAAVRREAERRGGQEDDRKFRCRVTP